MRESFFFPFGIPAFAMWTFILTIILLLFNDGPPYFPLDKTEDPIDCFGIKFIKSIQNESRITFYFKVIEFPQYPKEVAPYLLSINTKEGNKSLEFVYRNFLDLETNITDFSFSILQSISGDIDVSVNCHKQILGSSHLTINSTQYLSNGFSTMSQTDKYIKITNFCIQDNYLVYASQQNSNLGFINFSDSQSIPIKTDYRCMEDFRNTIFGTHLTHHNSIFVSIQGTDPFNILIEAIIPSFLALQENSTNEIFLINGSQSHFLFNLEKVAPVTVYHTNDRHCFIQGRFVLYPNNIKSNDYENYTLSILQKFDNESIQSLRQMYTTRNMTKGTIICDKGFTNLMDSHKIERNIKEIPQTDDISEIAEEISKAEVLITTDITSLVFGIFMNAGGTLVYFGNNRIKIMEEIAKLTNCRTFYKEVNENEKTNIDDLLNHIFV